VTGVRQSVNVSASVSASAARPSFLALALTRAIKGYQRFISPALPPACRFTPSCSQYALEAMTRYGVARGGWLAARRLARCHPFHRGGPDPVP